MPIIASASGIPDLALSVCEPWAWAIVAGWKSIENRSWAIPSTIASRLPLRIAVHASLSTRFLEDEEVDYWLQDLHPGIAEALFQEPEEDRLFNPGCLVGCVDLLGCVPYNDDQQTIWQEIRELFRSSGGLIGGVDICKWQEPHSRRSPPLDPLAWASAGASLRNYCFLLANAIRFRQPIPAKGKLNFWKLDSVHQAAIRRQLKQHAKPPQTKSQPVS